MCTVSSPQFSLLQSHKQLISDIQNFLHQGHFILRNGT